MSGPAYTASKHGARAMSATINAEEGIHGIRSVCINPGEVETPILDTRPRPPSAEDRAVMVQPEDIAAAAVFAAQLPRPHLHGGDADHPHRQRLLPRHRQGDRRSRGLMAAPYVNVRADTLRGLIAPIFTAAGCDAAEAGRIGHHLVSANLAGHDSHGVIRVPRYVSGSPWAGCGRPAADASCWKARPMPSLDGNLGFGQTIGPAAVDLGIAKARAAGLAVVTLRNAGHIGRIGDWAERAAEAGLVSIHFVNVGMGEVVAPYGGTERRFGTNPFCIGVPQPDGAPPLLLDFATSIVAEGKVLVASNGGKPVPGDALIGPDGAMSGDPRVLYGPIEGTTARDPGNGDGALRAFGEHKGSGIAFMCEILAGCFAGCPTAGPLPGGKRGGIVNGMVSIYLDPGHFGSRRLCRGGAVLRRARPRLPARPTRRDRAGARRRRGPHPRCPPARWRAIAARHLGRHQGDRREARHPTAPLIRPACAGAGGVGRPVRHRAGNSS